MHVLDDGEIPTLKCHVLILLSMQKVKTVIYKIMKMKIKMGKEKKEG